MALASSISRIIDQGADRLVTEHHVDGAGVTHVLTYAAPPAVDAIARLIEHGAALSEELAARELDDLLNA